MRADRPLGPGWWQASDLNWYPPEMHPDPTYRQSNVPAGPFTAAPSPKLERQPYTWKAATDGHDHRAGPVGNHLETGEIIADTSKARLIEAGERSGRVPTEGVLALTDRRLLFAGAEMRRPMSISRDDIADARTGWAKSPGFSELRIETRTGSRYLFHTGKLFARSVVRTLARR